MNGPMAARNDACGSSGDVRHEVKRLMDVLGSDGAYIVCPAHVFQPDTSPENMMAVYDTALAYRPSSWPPAPGGDP